MLDALFRTLERRREVEDRLAVLDRLHAARGEAAAVADAVDLGLDRRFAAILAPSALSLLTTTFTEPKERAKAFGIFGAIAAAGIPLANAIV